MHRRVVEYRRAGALDHPHPALPFLALTVLAAAEMGASSSVASHNYYVPLRKLIDASDTEHGAPGTFTDYISLLWKDLAKWANKDLDGQRGRLVLRPPGHLRYVGLALQHALIRSSDLRRLDDFFRRIGLEPGEEVASSELRRGLELWVSPRPEGWAHRLHRVASDNDLAEYCEGLLERAASAWDGRPRDVRTGRPVGRLRLGTPSLKRLALSMYAQRDERLPDNLTMSIGGDEIDLNPWHGWFEPMPVPVDAVDALNEGLDLSAGSITFSFNQDHAHALGYDDDLGSWVTVDRLAFGERYAVLLKTGELTRALSFFKEASAVPALAHPEVPGLPLGWSLIDAIRLDAQPAVTPPESLAALIPAGSGPRLRLLEGLRVSAERHVYLRGGEPALSLSSLVESDRFEIQNVNTSEWKSYQVPDSLNREAALWELGLNPGEYDATHGQVTIRFTIVDGIAETAGPGVGSVTQPARDGVEVSGVTAQGAPQRGLPLTVAAPPEYSQVYLVGPGRSDLHHVELPLWIADYLGFVPGWRSTDAWVSFTPAWEITANDHGSRARALSPTPPEATETRPLWSDIVAAAELVEGAPGDALKLWNSYKEAAFR